MIQQLSRETFLPWKSGNTSGRCESDVFPSRKVHVCGISNKRHTLQTTYTLHGKQLEVVDSGKYLGFTISQDLQWNKHIKNTNGIYIQQRSVCSTGTMLVVSIYQKYNLVFSHHTIDRVCCHRMGPPSYQLDQRPRTGTAQTSTICIYPVHRHFPMMCHWTIRPTTVGYPTAKTN